MAGDDQLEFNVGEDEQEKTVSMNDDGSEAEVLEKEEPPVVEQEASKSEKREELEHYSASVQNRINKLTARLREAERRENAAIEYAKNVQGQHQELQKKLQHTNSQRISETSSRIETQMMALKHVIKRAREEADFDTETEAQQRLTALIMEQARVKEANEAYKTQQNSPSQPAAAPPSPQRRPEPDLDPKAEAWAERNGWFGQDIVMTNTVRGIHVELVQNEGFDPTSDEYYDEIDRRMQQMFPEKLGGRSTQTNTRSNRPVQTVASANRATGTQSARRTVKLKPSQVAIAKKLGVPLEEYAKYVRD